MEDYIWFPLRPVVWWSTDGIHLQGTLSKSIPITTTTTRRSNHCSEEQSDLYFKFMQGRQQVTFNGWLRYQNTMLLKYARTRCAAWCEPCNFGLKPSSFYKLCTIMCNLCRIQSTVCSLLPVLHSPFVTETSVRSALAKGSSEFPL